MKDIVHSNIKISIQANIEPVDEKAQHLNKISLTLKYSVTLEGHPHDEITLLVLPPPYLSTMNEKEDISASPLRRSASAPTLDYLTKLGFIVLASLLGIPRLLAAGCKRRVARGYAQSRSYNPIPDNLPEHHGHTYTSGCFLSCSTKHPRNSINGQILAHSRSTVLESQAQYN
jgi:hypothetical protein